METIKEEKKADITPEGMELGWRMFIGLIVIGAIGGVLGLIYLIVKFLIFILR